MTSDPIAFAKVEALRRKIALARTQGAIGGNRAPPRVRAAFDLYLEEMERALNEAEALALANAETVGTA